MSKWILGLWLMLVTVSAIACEGARLVSHPSSPNSHYPTAEQWRTGLGYAVIEAYGALSPPGEYCVKYPDGIIERVVLFRSAQIVSATPIAGTRQTPRRADEGGGEPTYAECSQPKYYGRWEWYGVKVLDDTIGGWEFVVYDVDWGPGC